MIFEWKPKQHRSLPLVRVSYFLSWEKHIFAGGNRMSQVDL